MPVIAAALISAAAGGYLVGHSGQRTRVIRAAVPPARRTTVVSGYAAGRRAGYNAGFNRELRAARQAQSSAFDAGSQAVFQGFGSGWSTSRPYIVEISRDPQGRYSLHSRLAMDPTQDYHVCQGQQAGICGGPLAATTNPSPTGTAPSGSAAPADFCSTHVCIPSFASGTGYIVQCADGEWSHSGGNQGACSDHGGETSTTYP